MIFCYQVTFILFIEIDELDQFHLYLLCQSLLLKAISDKSYKQDQYENLLVSQFDLEFILNC